ncbi:hypothetical protein TVAG_302350 [Trichomonas vaginalis G3]|uniref:Uncharacterized protein n=1 Tax=Trichomonas vaginalis (strain ATCC PRA-98 / G3) TaxID=412133 RepID=A2EGR0_TRIV3|nr:hypothetical protein TVAGG3_0172980 [Trichomonas vaginalis G3]EAY08148.1 hypothetical protein TVAG_302350 [Trichomonas vaginalis G3]KAI5548721.1 hypothetical protein TVAGG3_0172980 [Trichomonas vaginalis G3]|eukprot:XP_001320371.1 hypothetical protein [Trichomonas vaginalis G3]
MQTAERKFVIQRAPSKKRTTKRYSDYLNRIAERRRLLGSKYFDVEKTVNSFLKSQKKKDLLAFVSKVKIQFRQKIERVLSRTKEGIYIWLCEHWDQASQLITFNGDTSEESSFAQTNSTIDIWDGYCNTFEDEFLEF